MTGSVQVYTPGLSCYECGLSRDEFNHIMVRTGCADVINLQSSAGRVATTPISASIIGAIEVQEAMKIIHLDTESTSQFKTLQGKLLQYEGLTNSTNVYKFASWKNNCPAHESWEPVIEGTDFSATQTVREILSALKSLLHVEHVEINMCNNKFVDRIVSDKPEKEFKVMVPDSQLDNCMSNNDELRKLRYVTIFHKSFFENIDADFPYQDLTLQQIGIPLYDVLHVSTEKGVFHVELSADAPLFL